MDYLAAAWIGGPIIRVMNFSHRYFLGLPVHVVLELPSTGVGLSQRAILEAPNDAGGFCLFWEGFCTGVHALRPMHHLSISKNRHGFNEYEFLFPFSQFLSFFFLEAVLVQSCFEVRCVRNFMNNYIHSRMQFPVARILLSATMPSSKAGTRYENVLFFYKPGLSQRIMCAHPSVALLFKNIILSDLVCYRLGVSTHAKNRWEPPSVCLYIYIYFLNKHGN